MRKIFFINALIFLLASTSSAQNNGSLHLGVHYFNLEDEKFSLDFINIGYQKNMGKRWNWDSSLGFISYSRQEKDFIFSPYSDLVIEDPNAYFDDFNHSSILAFNSRFGYSFLINEKVKWGVAVGLTTVYATESRFSSGNSFYDPNTNFISYTSYAEYRTAYGFGWTPKLFYERKLNDLFSVEGAAEIYFHTKGEVPYMYALGLRVNYNLGKKVKSAK